MPTVVDRPVDYISSQSVEELNSGPPKTNPRNDREADLKPGPPDYKSITLTTAVRNNEFCRINQNNL